MQQSSMHSKLSRLQVHLAISEITEPGLARKHTSNLELMNNDEWNCVIMLKGQHQTLHQLEAIFNTNKHFLVSVINGIWI